MSLDNENINGNPVNQPLSQSAIHRAAKEAGRQGNAVLIYYGVSSENHTPEQKYMIEGMKGVELMGKLVFPETDSVDF